MQHDSTMLVAAADQIAPAHTALVLVDIQNDFVHPDGAMLRTRPAGFEDNSLVPSMLDRSAELLTAARRTGVLRVFVQMLCDMRYQSPVQQALAARRQVEAGEQWVGASGYPQEGTWGADFYGEIRPDGSAREVVVPKFRYSAFIGTNLDLVLRSNNIRTIVMCGDATSACVESTARDGFCLDYYVITAADACADFDVNRHDASLRKMDLSFGYVLQSQAIIDLWSAAGEKNRSADQEPGRAQVLS